jgi:phosphatidylserine/phosphatidylglycerophosphate/cardiolipin synthase-like enzyme
MGPKQLGGDDIEQPIIDFIDGAKKYLDIAVQEIDNKELGKAIVRARQRNVQVKLVLEADYLRAKTRQTAPWVPGGEHEINREIQNAILRTKAHVHSDFNPQIFHQKFVVRDRCEVLTGSTNFTHTGTHRNLNNVIIVRDKDVAMQYWREFKEISKGRFGKDSEMHPEKPKVSLVSDLYVKVLFAPDHNPEMEIMKQMAKAKERIDFAIFTFSKSSGIDDQMAAMMRAGVTVRGILEVKQGRQKWAPYKELKKLGADLYLTGKHPGLGKLHHKLMIIDKQVVILGSMNFTGPATKLNDENILVIGGMNATGVQKTAQKKFAKYAYDEVDRIIAQYS